MPGRLQPRHDFAETNDWVHEREISFKSMEAGSPHFAPDPGALAAVFLDVFFGFGCPPEAWLTN